jgi:hypothetical protein
MRIFLTVSFLIISSRLTGYGLADWQHTAPGGNVMSDPGNGTHLMILMTREELLVNRWYFYNGYIVGEMFSGFFIVDERTGQKSIF